MRQVEMPKIAFEKMSKMMNDPPKTVESGRFFPELKNR